MMMSSAKKASSRGSSGRGLPDIDDFWNTRDVSMGSMHDQSMQDDSDEQDFNYSTSSSISESDLDDSSVAAPSSIASNKPMNKPESRRGSTESATGGISVKDKKKGNKDRSISINGTSPDDSYNLSLASRLSSTMPLSDSDNEDSRGSNIRGNRSSRGSDKDASLASVTTPRVDNTTQKSNSKQLKKYFDYDTSADNSVLRGGSAEKGVGSASRSKHVSFSAEKELPSESADYGFDDNNRFEDEENEQEAEERGKLKDSVSSAATKKKSKKAKSNIKYKPYDPTTPGSAEFSRGRRISDASFSLTSIAKSVNTDSADEHSSGDDDDESGFVDTSYLQSVREREKEDVSDASDDEGDVRRSRRVTKGKRFQFWKNERPVYEQGRIVGLLTAEPTPKKKKRKNQTTGRGVNKKLKLLHRGDASDSDEVDVSFDMPSEYNYVPSKDGEVLQVWDDAKDNVAEIKVISNRGNLDPPSSLPITAPRPPGKEKPALAAQSFNIPEIPGKMSGWISGFVELPPQAIKDAEGVGLCSQVFFIGSCQDGAVELGMADPSSDVWDDATAQRVLLSTGDTFFVPPGNIYRVENHSTFKPCVIYWTIVKPIAT